MALALKLNTGDQIPAIGLGTWKIPKGSASAVVAQAVRIGYRHLDCACDYGNEAEVGQGIRVALAQGRCRRQDLWITSKLWNTYHSAEHVRPAAERSLVDLGADYFDLYLIHFPISLRYVPFEVRYPPEWVHDFQAEHPSMEPVAVPISETWQAMQELVHAGLVRNLGVCNFGCALMRDLLAYAEIPPAVLQIETHPFLTQEKLLRFCQEAGIVVTAFSPFGAQSYLQLQMASPNEAILRHPVVLDIAMRCERSPAQILLRWAIQRGTAVIPKATASEHLQENLAVFDFELSPNAMHALDQLNIGRRFNDPGVFCESAFGKFFPIFE